MAGRYTADGEFKLLAKDVDYIKKAVDKIDTRLSKDYVTHEEHDYLKEEVKRLWRIMYTIGAAVMLAIIGAIMSLVLRP